MSMWFVSAWETDQKEPRLWSPPCELSEDRRPLLPQVPFLGVAPKAAEDAHRLPAGAAQGARLGAGAAGGSRAA